MMNVNVAIGDIDRLANGGRRANPALAGWLAVIHCFVVIADIHSNRYNLCLERGHTAVSAVDDCLNVKSIAASVRWAVKVGASGLW